MLNTKSIKIDLKTFRSQIILILSLKMYLLVLGGKDTVLYHCLVIWKLEMKEILCSLDWHRC